MLIYQITNLINNKKYIGKTERTLNERFKEHCRFKKVGVMPICDAIKKYGKNNFIIETIFETEDSVILNEMETKFIELKKPEYNVAPGGIGGSLFKGKKHTESTKQKIGLSRKGKKDSTETKLKKSLAKIGKKQSEDSINKRIQKQSKNYTFLNENGDVINVFNLNKFCRDNNLSQSTMRSVFYGKINVHKGYRRIP